VFPNSEDEWQEIDKEEIENNLCVSFKMEDHACAAYGIFCSEGQSGSPL